MKKMISILMSCLFFSGIVYAEDGADSEALNSLLILQQLGLVSKDYGADSLDFNTGVTRAELASITEGVFNYGEYESDGLFYHDVSEEFWAFSSVSYLVSIGALTVPDERLFYPDRVATEAEAYKIIICSLGLGTNITSGSSWPSNVFKAAGQMNLTKGVMNDDRLTYAELFKMLHTSMLVELPDVLSDNKQTYLERYYDVHAAKGLVEMVGNVSLDESSGSENTIVIDGEKFDMNGIECDDFLGARVLYYYQENSVSGIDSLLWIEYTGRSTVISLTGKDNGISYDPLTRTITYYENGTKEKNIKLKDNISIVYNGRFLKSYHNEVLTSHIDTMRIVASDGGRDYDLLEIDAYENRIVNSIDIENKIIYTSGNESRIKLGDYEEYVLYNADGETIEISDLTFGDIISVYETKSNDLITIIASRKNVSGAIKGSSVNDFGYTEIDLDGEIYLSEYNYSGTNIKFSNSAKLIMDHKGFVVDIEYLTGDNTGLLVKFYNDEDNERAIFKIYKSNGTFVRISGAETIKIDGIKSTTYYQTKELLGGVEAQEQVILYGLNADGEINKIDTIRMDLDGTTGIERITNDPEKRNNPEVSAVATRRHYNNKLFITTASPFPSPSYIVDSETIVIGLPGSFGEVASKNEKDFLVMKGSEFGWGWRFGCDGYTIGDPDGTVDVLLIYNANWGSIKESGPVVLINRIYEELNEDDEIVTMFEGYGASGIITGQFAEDFNPSVKKGDFVRLTASGPKGYDNLSYIYKLEDGTSSFVVKQRQEVDSVHVVTGYVCAKRNNKLYISAEQGTGDVSEYYDILDPKRFSAQIHVFDTKTGKIIPNVTVDQIRASSDTGTGDKIITYTSGDSGLSTIVVYR